MQGAVQRATPLVSSTAVSSLPGVGVFLQPLRQHLVAGLAAVLLEGGGEVVRRNPQPLQGLLRPRQLHPSRPILQR